MKLPNVDQAVLPEAKFVHYLLSLEHSTGRSKAVFFMRFGFTLNEWEILRDRILDHARDHEVARTEETPYGTRTIIEGEIRSPDGRNPPIRSVWFVERNSDIPSFVTAYRLRKRGGR